MKCHECADKPCRNGNPCVAKDSRPFTRERSECSGGGGSGGVVLRRNLQLEEIMELPAVWV